LSSATADLGYDLIERQDVVRILAMFGNWITLVAVSFSISQGVRREKLDIRRWE
jgi:hypothetical protein